MKGTKLWNAPRSPLIEGRSRRDNAFGRDWLIGSSLGFIASALAVGLFLADKGASTSTLAGQVALPALAGSVLGSAGGVRLATGFGWHPRWIAGGILGALLGLITVLAVITVGIQLLGA